MKPFADRNPLVVGAIGIVVAVGLLFVALNANSLPFINGGKEYEAYFAEAGGLASGNPVQVHGLKVGQVTLVALDGPRVLVKFKVDGDVRLGDRAEAAVNLRTLLGSKLLEVTPRGDGQLTAPIPLERTTPAYQLPDALGDLSSTIKGLDTDQLSKSLAVLANEFSDTPPALKVALKGISAFSQTLDERDRELRDLLTNANKATKVLAERSDEVVKLITNTNALLVQLRTERSSLDQIAGNLSAAAQQLKGFIGENRDALKPALDKLNGVLTILDNRKEQIQKAIKGLNGYAGGLGEAVASGPFFKAYIVNLLPGQFVQPFIDAAFSDLGVDPATRLPSQLSDPQVGQPGTPPLPMPMPRTGQGGDPRLTIPDAITGKPGDQGCGPPGVPLPGPTGCYPYREPLPAPPPGGPPPGPPAVGPGPGIPSPSDPTARPAPGETAPTPSPVPDRPAPSANQPAQGGGQ